MYTNGQNVAGHTQTPSIPAPNFSQNTSQQSINLPPLQISFSVPMNAGDNTAEEMPLQVVGEANSAPPPATGEADQSVAQVQQQSSQTGKYKVLTILPT